MVTPICLLVICEVTVMLLFPIHCSYVYDVSIRAVLSEEPTSFTITVTSDAGENEESK